MRCGKSISRPALSATSPPPSKPRWNTQRRFARFAVALPVSVEQPASLGPIAEGRILDLGLGGLRCALPISLRLGQQVWLIFSLPGRSQTLRILGCVRYSAQGLHGIEFLSDTVEQRNLIRSFCSALLPLVE